MAYWLRNSINGVFDELEMWINASRGSRRDVVVFLQRAEQPLYRLRR